MPFRSLDDPGHMIEDGLPRQAKDLLAKAYARLKEHAGLHIHDSQDTLDEAYFARIVQAMADTHCGRYPDDGEPTTRKALMPRFTLRH
jgi:hypothetical protein